jgi:hypothetical protein
MWLKLNHSPSGGGAEEYSCHHVNNRSIKVDLIFEWRRESLPGQWKLNDDPSANRQQRVDKSEVGPISQPEPYVPLADELLEL